MCPDCTKPKEFGFNTLSYTHLPGYGNVLNSRIKEVERRVVIGSKDDKTGYYCGRMGENGKVQEREPNY